MTWLQWTFDVSCVQIDLLCLQPFNIGLCVLSLLLALKPIVGTEIGQLSRTIGTFLLAVDCLHSGMCVFFLFCDVARLQIILFGGCSFFCCDLLIPITWWLCIFLWVDVLLMILPVGDRMSSLLTVMVIGWWPRAVQRHNWSKADKKWLDSY